jgi:hypothetical protein
LQQSQLEKLQQFRLATGAAVKTSKKSARTISIK